MGHKGKTYEEMQKTSNKVNSVICNDLCILNKHYSLSTCWLALSGQFLNPKVGIKTKVKISNLRTMLHQPNGRLIMNP